MTVSRNVQWGDYKGIRKFESPMELPPDFRQFMLKLLFVQGDTEFASVQQHRPWLDRAPGIEERLTQARVVCDEMRHGWQVCKLLEDFGEEGERAIERLLARNFGEHTLDSFNMEFETWGDVVAFAFLVDRVGMYQLRAFEECSYGPLARAIPLMMTEEHLHISFGLNGMRKLAKADREEAQRVLDKWYPRALDMFGHKDSEGSEMAVKLGIKKWYNEEARQMYIEEVTPLIEKMGLRVPDPMAGRRIL